MTMDGLPLIQNLNLKLTYLFYLCITLQKSNQMFVAKTKKNAHIYTFQHPPVTQSVHSFVWILPKSLLIG